MAPGTNTPLIVGVGLAIAAAVTCIVSTAIPYWVSNSSSGEHYGLWQLCARFIAFGPVVCAKFIEVVGWMKGVRAMMILSILSLVASACCSFMFAFVMKNQKSFGLIGGALAFVGGTLSMIGAIIFAVKSSQSPAPGFSLHAGFGLAIVAAVFAIVAGISLLLGKRQADATY